MSVNAQAFHAVAGALQRFRGDDPLLAEDLPLRGVAARPGELQRRAG